MNHISRLADLNKMNNFSMRANYPKFNINTIVYISIIILISISTLFGINILSVQFLITIITGLFLFYRFLSINRQKKLHLLVAELFTPAMIWLLFGVGGIIALFRVDDQIFYRQYEDSSVLMVSIFAVLGMIGYFFGFWLVYNWRRKTKTKLIKMPLHQVYIVTFGILLFDWYMRFRMIQKGWYFNWVIKQVADNSIRGTDFLYQVYLTISFLSPALLLYFVSIKPKNWLYKAALFVQILLITATGDRINIIYATLILLISYFILYKIKMNFKSAVICIFIVLLFFGLLGPIIQFARVEMRADAQDLMANPLAIPVRFFTEYIPNVFKDNTLSSPSTSSQTQSLPGRLGSYMAYAASIYQSYIYGIPLFPTSQFVISLQEVLPRFIFPNKTILNEDALILDHFQIGYSGLDANGTYLTDVFTQLHVIGIIGLMLFAGAGIAFFSRHLENRYGLVGQIIMVGLLPNLIIAGDSFGNYLSDFRNIFLLLIALQSVLLIIQLIKPSQSTRIEIEDLSADLI